MHNIEKSGSIKYVVQNFTHASFQIKKSTKKDSYKKRLIKGKKKGGERERWEGKRERKRKNTVHTRAHTLLTIRNIRKTKFVRIFPIEI